MEAYNILTILVVLAALFGNINHRYIRIPGSVGIMLLSLLASLLIVVAGLVFPRFFIRINEIISNVDFHMVVMNVMLSFLLFAAGIQVDIKKMHRERAAIISFSTVGVLISTVVVGFLLYAVTSAFGLSVNLLYCLLFGALISPTDPVAVVGILKKAKLPSALETRISGESLFNDGSAVVLFITFFEVAQIGIQNTTIWDILWLFVRETGGGLLLGFLLGYLGYYLLRSIDNYVVEVMTTLALVMGGYLLAETILVSGPLAMVMAGLITGSKIMDEVMSDETRDYVAKFWEMMDKLMNAILFLLIGFAMLMIPFNLTLLLLGCITIVIVLFARLLAVSLPILLVRKKPFDKKAIPILTWGALRGGISVALALSVPKYMYGDMFLSITYIVVLFSIVVQGLTIGKLARKLQEDEQSTASAAPEEKPQPD